MKGDADFNNATIATARILQHISGSNMEQVSSSDEDPPTNEPGKTAAKEQGP